MMNDREMIAEFRKRTLPHLEDLLQLALGLTRNGCETIGLIREAMAEAFWTWDESMHGDELKVRHYAILTKRLSASSRGAEGLPAARSGAGMDGSLIENSQSLLKSTGNAQRPPWVGGTSEEVVKCRMAIARLPEVYRIAMILSYLEEFTDDEIANLTGSELHTVESVLSSGRHLIRSELIEVLTGTNVFKTVAYRESTSSLARGTQQPVDLR